MLTYAALPLQFFNFVALPLFSAMAEALPAIEPMLQHVKSNLTHWLALEAATQY